MNFNTQQREAINSRGHTIVSAGAGAGKTAVLVERFLSLIENDNVGVENILCLTFTRKAAGEMYQRIYQRLSLSPVSSRLQREFLRFDRARIMTIDSFCSNIIRPYATDYGYPPTFTVGEEDMERELRAFTLSYMADPERNEPIISRLLEQFSYQTLVEGLLMRLGTEFASPVRAPEGYEEQANALFLSLINEELASMLNAIPSIREVNTEERQAKANKDHHQRAIADLDLCLEEYEAVETPLVSLSMLDDLITLCQRSIAALGVLASGKTARKPWKEYKGLFERLETILFPSLCICSEHDFYREFYHFIEQYLRDVLEFKRQKGVLYYRDLLDMAIDILLNHPDFADFYRNEIKQTMIDEFQDNNRLQKDLLFLLSAPLGYCAKKIPSSSQLHSSGLFFVGDQKQSIYRFRGADVSVFKNLDREFQQEGSRISLDTNYRSSPDLIAFFNRLFPRIMGGEEDFEADYHPLEAGLKQQHPSRIELILLPEDEGKGDDPVLTGSEAEAYAIAESIHTLCKEGGKATITYKDIAILFRSGGMQFQIEKMLRRFAIPFSSDSTRSLFLDAPAFDTHAFLKLCLFPADRFSLAAVLRSPLCRIGDDSLARLLVGLSRGEITDGSRLSDPSGEPYMRPEESEKYNRLLDLLSHIRPMIGHRSHAEVLAEIWMRSGYFNFIVSNPHHQAYLEHYDYLLEFFDAYADRAMIELLEDLEENLGEAGKIDDIDIVRENLRGVQLMTVHKSKGLEFPVVFLVNTNGGLWANQEASSPLAYAENGALILYGGLGEENIQKFVVAGRQVEKFRNPLVKEAEGLERQMENAENRRLLYVALTRAKQHLFISASRIKATDSKNISSKASRDDRGENLFALLEAGLGLDMQEIQAMTAGHYSAYPTMAGAIRLNIPRPVRESDLRSSDIGGEIDDLSGPPRKLLLPSAPAIHFTVSDLQTRVYESEGAGRHIELGRQAEEDVAYFGSGLHTLLEETVKTFHRSGEIQIPEKPWLFTEHKDGAARYTEACEIVRSFTESPFFRNITSADEIYCELPFTMYLSPYYVNGQIDLIMRRGDKTLIVDYKSGAQVNPANYSMQLDLYRLALEQMAWPQVEAGIFDLRKASFSLLPPSFGREYIMAQLERLSTSAADAPTAR